MRILYAVVFLFLGLLNSALSKPIDEAQARQVGGTFLSQQTRLRGSSSQALVLSRMSGGAASSSAGAADFFVFNVNGSPGFVVVAGDDDITPVLGYSDQSGFDPANVPENMAKWLEGYRQEIRAVRANHLAASPDIVAAWRSLESGSTVARRGTTAVAPLVQAHWNQSPNYNALCPYDNAAGGRSVSGCVATAMVQVMKYWNYPTTGSGFHSYNTTNYGTLSANFGATTYQWASMPNTLSGPNAAVATLMYHAGVSVDMIYSANSSGAYVISAASPGTIYCAEYALKTFFGYRPTLQGIKRVNYTASTWISTLKAELDASRPIVYAGFGNGGGHCFVADGYDTNDFLHINWGWGGQSDGYFVASGLNPGGLGTGGGAGGYNTNQQAIIGIQPPSTTGPAPASMGLNSNVTPSASTVSYGQAFSVSANLTNTSTSTFTGDYGMAAFSSTGNFVDFIEVKTNNSLAPNFTYTTPPVFSTAGLLSLLPGTYQVGVFFRPTGGNWTIVANRNGYTNLVPLTITNVNAITLNGALTAGASGILTQGQSAVASVNIRNNGTSTFIGQYRANLYNLDGTFAQALGTVNESSGLPPNYTYNAPYVVFPSTNITVAPGSYLLAITHLPTSSTTAQLTGSTGTFQNPVLVTVQAPAAQPDLYEPNDAVAQSSLLPLTFTANNAVRNTTGSNAHTGADVDYYKMTLPAGYNYTLTARLHDSYNSGNSQTYTQDALFSYSTDGLTWSMTYDDVMPAPVVLNGGITLYIKVAPFFAGSTGTYLFEASIQRSVATATATAKAAGTLTVYPNPVQDLLFLDASALSGAMQSVRVRNALGQDVYQGTGSERQISVRTLAAGVYSLEVQTSRGLVTKKFVVSK